MMRYDIGLPDGNDHDIPILTDHLARAIMANLPVEHRSSLVRAVNNASEQIAASNDDWAKMQVLRGESDDGTSLSLSLTFIEQDEDDFIRRMILQGRISRKGLMATSELVRIDDVPEVAGARIKTGGDIRDIVDAQLLEGLRIARHTMAGNAKTNSLEIILQATPREDIEDIVREWMKRS